METARLPRCIALRLAPAALLSIVLLGACAGPRLDLASAPSQPSLSLAEAGIGLTILPNAWRGYPSDLSQYYTPVQVMIENDRPDEIQVRYRDFLVVDDARNQYRAVEPGEVARALYGGRRNSEPPLYAFSDPWWWYPYPYAYGFPFYSPFSPYPYFPASPYGYYRMSAYDLLTLGLREGPILPGARVNGFLYFQLATQTAGSLTLTWTPLGPDAKALATFRIELKVAR